MHIFSCITGNLIPRYQVFTNTYKISPVKYTVRSFMKKSRAGEGLKLTPTVRSEPKSPIDRVFPTSIKCLTFTVGFCGTVYVGASIWNYENLKKHMLNEQVLSDWIKNKWNKMEGYEHKEGDFRKMMNKWWNQLPDGEKVFWTICAANFFVFLCWRYPPLQSTMMAYFASSPAARAVCWPMFLSTFSHYALLHLGMNMYVLHSFINVTCNTLGTEQFVGFYLAGGVASSCVSNIFKIMTRAVGPSIGASGAIMALLGYFCTKYPEAKLGIVFLPNYPFTAGLAMKSVMFMDLLGVIFRWKLFDHAAHLGGAVFGVLYAMYGQSCIWGNRSYVTKVWENVSNRYVERKDK